MSIDGKRYIAMAAVRKTIKNVLNAMSSMGAFCRASTNQYPPPPITITVPRIVPTFCSVTALRLIEKSATMIAALPMMVSSGALIPAELTSAAAIIARDTISSNATIRSPRIHVSAFNLRDPLHAIPYPRSRAPNSASSEAIGMRACSIVSRSLMVTALSSSESKSTVMHSGVPISSCRR